MNVKVVLLLLLAIVATEVESKKGKGKSHSSSGSKSSKSHHSHHAHGHSHSHSRSSEEEGAICGGVNGLCDKTDSLMSMVEELINRRPCVVNIPPGSHCDCAYERKMGFLIVDRKLPDSSLTSSSSYSGTHNANRARMDADTAYPCSWTPTVHDPSPYIQVDLLETSVVFGAVIQKRCDNPYTEQYVTSYKVQAQFGGFWEDVHYQETCSYSFGVYDYGWFKDPIEATKFRILPLTHHSSNPSLRFDLIGYV